MDFEEFLWLQITMFLRKKSANTTRPMKDICRDTHSFIECRTVQQAILNGYDSDMGKYAKPATTVKINACWNSIPAQPAKENKKFQYKLAKKGGTAKIFGFGNGIKSIPLYAAFCIEVE